MILKPYTHYNYHIASFDVESLFTNLPVNKTIQIISNKLFPNSDSIFLGLNKKLFFKVMQLYTEDNLFLFNSETFFQIDGASMGGCVMCIPYISGHFYGFS